LYELSKNPYALSTALTNLLTKILHTLQDAFQLYGKFIVRNINGLDTSGIDYIKQNLAFALLYIQHSPYLKFALPYGSLPYLAASFFPLMATTFPGLILLWEKRAMHLLGRGGRAGTVSERDTRSGIATKSSSSKEAPSPSRGNRNSISSSPSFLSTGETPISTSTPVSSISSSSSSSSSYPQSRYSSSFLSPFSKNFRQEKEGIEATDKQSANNNIVYSKNRKQNQRRQEGLYQKYFAPQKKEQETSA